MLLSPLNAEFQKTEQDLSEKTKPEKDSVMLDGGAAAVTKDTKTPAEEQAGKTAEEKTHANADTKMDGEDKQPKAMGKEKAKTKPTGKAKTKTKEAGKPKAKTADKKKKATAKKTVKSSSKKTEGKQPKAKSSKSDSQKKKDEL